MSRTSFRSRSSANCRASGLGQRLVDRDTEPVQLLVVGPAEVHAVREQYDREVLRRVDPHARAGEPGVAERVLAEERQPLGRTQHETDATTHAAAAVRLGPSEIPPL